MNFTFCLWSRCCFKSGGILLETCPILKFSSNLKPQARSIYYKLVNYSSVLHYQKKFSVLRRPTVNKTLMYFNLVESHLFDVKRLFCYNLSCCNSMLFKIGDFQCNKYNTSVDWNVTAYPYLIKNLLSRSYSNKKSSVNNNKHLAIKRHEYIKGVLREKQRRIRQTQLRLKRRGRLLLNDIKETKSKMKVKMEEIIERENVWTIPNLLCITRIAISPYLGYLIMHSDYNLALGFAVFAGVTDLLDGFIARTFKSQSSKLGSFLDPMADKLLIATLFLTLTISGNMPVPLTVLIIARDVVLFGAGFYIRYQSLPPPRTLSRYFDMTHATAQLAPTTLSKINTMIQLLAVFSTLTAVTFDYSDHPALHAVWYLTGASTIASALSYLTAKNTYKILKKKKFK